ncbi:MAG TPA: hypothetical protein DCM07_25695 [Planctomycetaceae bacterium]|nr:hypothetical protein [Gimesia sp.]HAH48184.1 hypothetical protein [Planctomycetaceae bacterium]HBL46521.1 hypothetical protein [Planctomycetaceae bacterium]
MISPFFLIPQDDDSVKPVGDSADTVNSLLLRTAALNVPPDYWQAQFVPAVIPGHSSAGNPLYCISSCF